MSNDKKKMPVFKRRYHGTSVSVWENTFKTKDGEERKSYGIQLEHTYRDKNGEWQTTSNIDANNVGTAIGLLQMAQRYTFELEHKKSV